MAVGRNALADRGISHWKPSPRWVGATFLGGAGGAGGQGRAERPHSRPHGCQAQPGSPGPPYLKHAVNEINQGPEEK